MGNAIEKSSPKMLPHPHLDEQISQAFEHGNPLLLYYAQPDTSVRQVLLDHFPVILLTPPKHGYIYMGVRNITNVEGIKIGGVLGASLSWFLMDHPTAIYAYFSAAILNNPNTDESLRQKALSYRTDPSDKMVGEQIIDLIKHGEMSIAEMTKAYPVKFPERLTDDLTDDQLLWLLLAGEEIVDMEVSDQQMPRLLAALVKADLYACHDWLTAKDLISMLPNILIRWHHLRNVASNYFHEVVAPYYLPLFQFLFKHNFLNKITQQDANLLTLVYPELLGDNPEKWCEGPAHQRSVKCLPYHTLYHMLGGNISLVFFHPTNKQVWREELSEILEAEEPPTQDIDRWGYYGSLWCNSKYDTDIVDGNSTDLTGVPISHYNVADVVVIYDVALTTQYYITRTELPELMKTKVNPYNQEVIPDQQLVPYQYYLNWHSDNTIPVVSWEHQWRMLKHGDMILPSAEEIDNLIAYYITGETLSADGTYKFEIDVNALESMDKEEMTDIITQANHEIDRVYDNDPAVADGLKGIMGGIAQIMVLTDDSGKRIKGTGESSDNPRIKLIED